ncbi:MAG: ribosome silencing factor [Anaplasma sp.]
MCLVTYSDIMRGEWLRCLVSKSTMLRDSVVDVLDEHSASDVVVLDVAGRCQLAEHMIIASGNSPAHVKALAEHVKKRVSPARTIRVEGLREGNWVVVSMRSVVVHILKPEVRSYYKLEELWGSDATQVGQHPEM